MSGSAALTGSGPAPRASLTGYEPAGRAAAALSIVVHAGLIGVLWPLAMRGPRPLPPPAAMTILFEPAAPQALSAATLAAQSRSTPDALTDTLPRLVVKATAPPARPRAVAAPAVRAATIAPPPLAAARPVQQAEAPAVSQGDIAGLKLRIREAVRVATVYPAVARQMHREGHAQVSFDYIDGTAQDVSLAHSSQSRLLDEAALSAVRRAAYPRPLPGMGGTRLSLMVWVNFGLEKED